MLPCKRPDGRFAECVVCDDQGCEFCPAAPAIHPGLTFETYCNAYVVESVRGGSVTVRVHGTDSRAVWPVEVVSQWLRAGQQR